MSGGETSCGPVGLICTARAGHETDVQVSSREAVTIPPGGMPRALRPGLEHVGRSVYVGSGHGGSVGEYKSVAPFPLSIVSRSPLDFTLSGRGEGAFIPNRLVASEPHGHNTGRALVAGAGLAAGVLIALKLVAAAGGTAMGGSVVGAAAFAAVP